MIGLGQSWTSPPLWRGLGASRSSESAGAAIGASALSAGFNAAAGIVIGLIRGLLTPDLTKIRATAIVNEIEADHLKPNVEKWRALRPEEKTPEVQAAAEQVFLQAWNGVLQGCGRADLGQAGVNCIGDRQRGGKWDWFVMYYDPIAQDPDVAANQAAGLEPSGDLGSSGGFAGTGISGTTLGWIGGGMLGLLLLIAALQGAD